KPNEVVTVSAKASYNIQLGRNESLSYLSTFDLSTGQEATSASSSKNTLYGRMLGYGVTLQLLGDDIGGTTGKGLKGLELPVGETTLNLNLALSGTVNGTDLSSLEYSAYNSNAASGITASSVDLAAANSEEGAAEVSDDTKSEEGVSVKTTSVVMAVLLASGTGEDLTETVSEALGIDGGIAVITATNVDLSGSAGDYVSLSESSTEYTTEDTGGNLISVSEGTKTWTFTSGSSEINITSEDTAEGIIGIYSSEVSRYPTVGSSDYLRMRNGTQIQIPVSSSEASGTISVTSVQGAGDRYYYLVKDGSVDTTKAIPSDGTTTLEYDSEYLTYNSTTGLYYLTLQSTQDCKRITNITVTYKAETAFITQAYVYFPGSESDYTENSTEISSISYIYGGATTSSNESSTDIAYNGKTIFTLGSTARMQSAGYSVTNSLDGVGSYTTSLYTASSNRTIEVKVPDDAVDAELNVWLFTNGTRYAYLDGCSTSYDGSISVNSNCVLTYSGLSAGTTYTFQCSTSGSSYSAGTYRLYGISLTTTSPESSASEEESDYQMTPILWDYRSNSNATSQTTQIVGDTTYTDGYGNWDRNIDWDDANNRTNHARNVSPYNSSASNFMLDDTKTGGAADAKECFYGGKWYVSEDKKITSAEDMDYNDFTSSYPVTVSLYTFDFDTYKTTWPSVTSGTYPFLTHRFPINNGGSSTTVEEYANYFFCYSAGYFQVLVPLPESANASTTSLYLTASVSDGTVTSLTNAAANAGSGGTEATGVSENETSDSVDISTAINTLKYNSFMNRIDTSNGGYYDSDGYLRDSEGNLIDIDITSSREMFMGTKWSTYGSDHDASAVAGETIDLWGAVISVTGTDHILTAANLLQIFDSAAFEVAGEPEAGYAAKKTVYGDTYDMLGEEGKINFLYVGDTAYKKGYDSTDDSTFEYMKSVREDTSTLRFYTSLDALEGDGLTCVGIYMEIRNAYIKQGNYAAFRLPVTVKATDENGDSTLNNVYCTMNQSRVWTYISGFPQEHQPMYYDSSAYETSRYAIAENSGGVYYNSNGSYDDSEFYSSSWFTTSSGEDNSSVSYLSPKSTSYTDDEGDEHTGYYLVQNENTVTDSGNYGYYKTVYADNYTDDDAGMALYYHNTNKNYSRASSAYTRGMSLLITGYESTLNISSSRTYWSKSNGDTPEFILSGIKAENYSDTAYSSGDTTSLKATVSISENLKFEASTADITIGKTKITAVEEQDDGSYVYDGVTYTSLSEILNDQSLAASYTFSSYTVYLYAVISADGSTMTIYVDNMPLGVELSNISFNTSITTTATSASSTLTATISGKDDLRDYNTSYGTSEANETAVSVDLTSVSSTGYVKYAGENNKLSDIVELNADSMSYKISYTNGETTDIESFSIFDIFPYNGDENGTAMSQISDGYDAWLTLKSLALTVSGSKASPNVTYYYTTASPQTRGGDIENLLTCYSDENNYSYLNAVFISGNSYSSYKAGVLDSTSGINATVSADAVNGLSPEEITGICVDIEGDSGSPAIPAGSTIELTLTFEGTIHSAEVQSRDSYGYTEYGSEADTDTAAGDKFINSAYIKTNKVSSTSRFNLTNNASLGVLSREISGRAFADKDHSGTYNSGDVLLANVGVDLYKWDGTAYTQVTTKDLLIETTDYTDYFSTVTDSDGAYRFYGLPDGYYIVAFKDTQTVTLTKYELAEYQVGSDTTIDSDGILVSAITDTEALAALSSGYVYAIQPSSGQAYIKLEGSYSNVSETGLVSANNDLGLDKGYSLPESGGWGADKFRLWGAALLAIGAVLLVSKKIFKAA
ncbi:MAG: hypothetical protein LUG66_08405, partial [Clostridiales bacterium]|nr:hypothetical protein [Clostridiales bacterium]